MTRQEIESLKEGDYVQRTYDSIYSTPDIKARWSKPERVLRISYRGVSPVDGAAYVGFWTDWMGDGVSEMSGSIREGERHVRMAQKEV